MQKQSLDNDYKLNNSKTLRLNANTKALTYEQYLKKTSNNEVKTPKQRFEAFLTYKKRLSRLAIVQSLYFYDQYLASNKDKHIKDKNLFNECYRTIIFFYKRFFFPKRYGENVKNKKLEEGFIQQIIYNFISEQVKIDNIITKYLSKKWRISKLNSIIRAGLRAAVCEAFTNKKCKNNILISEYTNLISDCVISEKEVDFFNAILENILKDIKQKYE